jgi:antitoxin ParD1/3/4
MSFALPESMREYIDARVAAGNYGNTSEYIRDLVRRDQEEQAKKRLRDLIEEGLASGPGRPRTKANDKELLAIARGEIDWHPAEAG